MAKMDKELKFDIKVSLSLWEAIKIRISGIFKNAESFNQVGSIVKIKYKK